MINLYTFIWKYIKATIPYIDINNSFCRSFIENLLQGNRNVIHHCYASTNKILKTIKTIPAVWTGGGGSPPHISDECMHICVFGICTINCRKAEIFSNNRLWTSSPLPRMLCAKFGSIVLTNFKSFNVLCQGSNWLHGSEEEDFLNVVHVLSLFCYHLPLWKDMVFPSNKFY